MDYRQGTMVILANMTTNTAQQKDGLRPINLRTDLAELADLIELVFRDVMDASGRAAIQEMRYISRMGPGLNVLNRLNNTALGISKGFVWIQDGRLVGNASIYPSNWPKDMGTAWMIANVGVHPDYQRRGIARHLMEASLDLIRELGGQHAVLQVDYDNHAALHLYNSMNFVRERAFNMWSRSALAPAPSVYRNEDLFLARRRDGDWREEYDLAQHTRPNSRGGIGWTKPTHPSQFRMGFWQSLTQLFSLNSRERMVIRDRERSQIRAALWAETGFGLSRTRLTLLVDPDYVHPYAEALLNNMLRRHRTTAFIIDHPYDDDATNDLLFKYRFRINRTVWHMRLDLE